MSQAAAAAGELGLGLTSGRGVGSVVHVGTRVLRLTHVLGEGGYSFVYLAKDVNTGREYALKKMLCQSSEQLELAKNEIDVMHLFKGHKNLLRLIDSDSARKGNEGDRSGSGGGGGGGSSTGGSVVHLLFEVYKDGTVLDLIEGSEHVDPLVVLNVFLQVCEGTRHMHSCVKGAPYAHRDIKPHNVLLSKQNTQDGNLNPFHAVVMDFGSTRPARITVTNRQQALKVQEEAEAHSTGTYRPPELFDTPSQCEIDEKTDVWSLGCLLYYMIYGESPFEYVLNEAGGSLALAVISGKVSWPDKGVGYHKKLAELAKFCMKQDPKERPSVDQVLEEANKAYESIKEKMKTMTPKVTVIPKNIKNRV